MFLADRHNFGKQVERIMRGSDQWYQKPRTVYWEWLFFGKTSPLKAFFNGIGENGKKPLADYFFNLDVEVTENWSGYVREVKSADVPLTEEHFYAFGALIAYCFIFGIRDLHKQNIIRTATHFQAVDIEVVFVDIKLPHETLLLPLKGIGYEFAGIGALVSEKEQFTQSQIIQLLRGYWDLFSVFKKNVSEIDAVLSTLNFSEIPARVIVRNTSEYRDFLERLPSNALVSEIEQIKRGDIPFYFKFIGDDRLYWKKEEQRFGIEEFIEIFKRDIDRHGKFIPKVCLQRRSKDLFLVQGCLFLLKYFGLEIETSLSDTAKIYRRSIVICEKTFKY